MRRLRPDFWPEKKVTAEMLSFKEVVMQDCWDDSLKDCSYDSQSMGHRVLRAIARACLGSGAVGFNSGAYRKFYFFTVCHVYAHYFLRVDFALSLAMVGAVLSGNICFCQVI